MIKSSIIKSTAAGAAALAIVGLTACTSTATRMGAQSMQYGQESSLHTPQGETGSPHGHGSTAAAPRGATTQMGVGTAPQANVIRSAPMGQESSTHTPQGETGSPHTH